MKQFFFAILAVSLMAACKSKPSDDQPALDADMHTFSNYRDVPCRHLDWNATVDFEKKQIRGVANWTFDNISGAKHIHFDTYALGIGKVRVNGREASFTQTTFDKVYGNGLSIPIEKGDSIVSIEYITGATSIALQWLSPEQTAGKKLPYLFTQCESIFARSLMPCQDVPAIRITYNAEVQVPAGMMAVMSAKNPTERNPEGKYRFEMEVPVPTYLIALAVGDISYQAIDARTGVYTEPSMLADAAAELSDVPRMMEAAEALGGAYKWGRYDVLIAPPSFPIGGMENPRLTFATPTIIAGDKSLVSLIAHEMAHSWSGNLVTNATWNDMWLNEGYTTYFERRIMEHISGKEYNDMLWELGFQDLQHTLDDLGANHPDTRLRVELKGRNPGEAFTDIPYEKGAVFLRMLEEQIGREKFDVYLNDYFQKNAFQPMTTDKCLAYMKTHLFGDDNALWKKLLVDQWVFEPGLPDNCPRSTPKRFLAVDTARQLFEQSKQTSGMATAGWTTHEWLHFLRKLKRPQDLSSMQMLDKAFAFTSSTNSEIADEWFKLAIASDYEAAYPAMRDFLGRVGRKKFLEPLYSELIKTEKGRKMATEIFTSSKSNYHPLTALKIEQLLK
jgi:aminopeptidase N